MKNFISFLLIFILTLGCLAGCSEEKAAGTTAEPTLSEEDQAILAARRDTAEAYMRQMATIMWRAGEDVDYYIGKGELHIKAGRLYRGIPYAYAAGSDTVFLSFSGGQDEKGVHQISGLTTDLMGSNGENLYRVGNDCSGALVMAWSQVGNSFASKNTRYMVPNHGYLRVGQYVSSDEDNKLSANMCKENGPLVMYEAYTQLQKADAVVRRDASAGHVMMITSVHVERNQKGNVDGNASYVTVLHQTRKYLASEAKAFDEAYGEDVYQTYGIDDKLTFFELFNDGYLPITCLEFIDPSCTAEEATMADSIASPTIEDLYKGEFISNQIISMVEITVTDEEGNQVQYARAFGDRHSFRNFQMTEFVDYPTRIVGGLDMEALKPGTYTFTYDATLSTGTKFTPRSFTYTVE